MIVEIVHKLHAEIVRVLRIPEIRLQLESQSFEVIAGNPDEYENFTRRDMARWAKALQQAGIKPE